MKLILIFALIIEGSNAGGPRIEISSIAEGKTKDEIESVFEIGTAGGGGRYSQPHLNLSYSGETDGGGGFSNQSGFGDGSGGGVDSFDGDNSGGGYSIDMNDKVSFSGDNTAGGGGLESLKDKKQKRV